MELAHRFVTFKRSDVAYNGSFLSLNAAHVVAVEEYSDCCVVVTSAGTRYDVRGSLLKVLSMLDSTPRREWTPP